MKGQPTARDSSQSLVDTPIGRLLICACDAGVTAVSFVGAEKMAPSDAASGGLAGVAAQEITEYFQGKRRSFSVPVSLGNLSNFATEVLKAVRSVPFGQTVTYGEIARMIKRPGAARAVGQALAQNPLPLLIPCHRVIQKNGAAGGFTWQERGSAASGIWIKLWLLEWESQAEFRLGSARGSNQQEPGSPPQRHRVLRP